MRCVYTPEIVDYIKAHCKEMTIPEMVTTLNGKFGSELTLYGLRSYYTRHDIHPSPRKGRKGNRRKFPEDLEGYIRSIASGRLKTEILDMVNDRYGNIMEMYQLRAYMTNHHIVSGLNCSFRKGHTPWNKYISYKAGGRSAETQFKKGGLPPTWKPVGSERIDRDGYTQVKVEEPDVWKLKHRVIWEQAHGEIPEGNMVTFKDGNKRNFDLNNLACITKSQNAVLCKMGLHGSGEGFDTALRVVEVTMKANEKQRDRKKRKKGGDAKCNGN